MFDEVDEGTAIFKMAPTPNELPTQGTFVPLNIDGQSLPSDWYLRVADEAGKMLRGEIPLQPQLPISPQLQKPADRSQSQLSRCRENIARSSASPKIAP